MIRYIVATNHCDAVLNRLEAGEGTYSMSTGFLGFGPRFGRKQFKRPV